MPTGLTIDVPGPQGVSVALPIMTLPLPIMALGFEWAESAPWWLQLAGIVAANILGIKVRYLYSASPHLECMPLWCIPMLVAHTTMHGPTCTPPHKSF